MELLFFDTFSHENNEELNLDLVQFPTPVCIYEVRIIPLGSRVKADFPGGVRLGATNPSSFSIDFFVNDLSKAGASTFAQLGSLDYKQNVTIQLNSNSKIPTDGLVLQGWYSTVTLAVFGILTDVVKAKSPSPPPPPPPRIQAVSSAPTDFKASEPGDTGKPNIDWHMNESLVPQIAAKAQLQPVGYTDPQHASYPADPYPRDPAYSALPAPAAAPTGYPEQAAPYHCPAPEYAHGPQYGDPNWVATAQPQPYIADQNVFQAHRDDHYGPEQSHRPRDYHHDRLSLSPGRDRDFSDDRHRSQEHDDRRYRESRHKRASYSHNKDRESRRTRSRSRDRTPHRDKRPHSPPLPRSSNLPLSSGGATSPHSKSRHCSPSYTPPLDEKTKKLKDSDTRNKDGDRNELGSDNSGIEDENDGFEEILSEEEGMFDVDEVIDMAGDDYDGDEIWNNYMPHFNPYQFELIDSLYFSHPRLTEFEVALKKIGKVTPDELPENAAKLLEIAKLLSQEPRDERWVESIEAFSTIVLDGLPYLNPDQFQELLPKMVNWTCHALDYEQALNQQQPVFKIRHLKAGIKLASTLFHSNDVIIKSLCKQNVPKLLLDLFFTEHMALSIKLLLLKGIDALTNHHLGLVYVTNKLDNGYCCYESLVQIALSKQVTRTMMAVKALLRKIHLFELLQKLKTTVWQIVQMSQSKGNSDDGKEKGLNENNIEDMISAFIEAKNVLAEPHLLIGQPGRSFPLNKIYEIHKPTDQLHHPGLFALFDSCSLLESVCLVLTAPITCSHSAICRTVRSLLQVLLSSHHGRLFLASHPSTTNIIIRILLQTNDEMQEMASSDETESQQLGVQLAYHLHSLHLIDSLFNFHQHAAGVQEIDNSEAVNLLQNLYTLVFTHVGRNALVDILGSNNNLDAILPFIQISGDEKIDGTMHQSACHGYACDLLLTTMRSASQIPMLKKYSNKILNMKIEESCTKLMEVKEWLAPTKDLVQYSAEEIEQLMNVVKECVKGDAKLSPQLVTCLRILQHMCIAPDHGLPSNDVQEELKYKYAIIQVFAHDGLAIFSSLLQKFCSENISITNDASHLIGQTGQMLVAAFQPICLLIKHMLSYLIHCRANHFKDLTALPTLLGTFHFLSVIGQSSSHQVEIQKIQKVLIETLLAYTQPILSQTSESDEAISKSLWTQMVLEVVKFIEKTPKVFVSGLNVLSELLPVPLPIQTRQALTTDEVTKSINIRKLWCAHLHPLEAEIHKLIHHLCCSSCPILQHVLKRVCLQLADLAAPTSITVVRAILAAFIENTATYSEVAADDVESNIPEQVSRILNLLVYLLSNPAVNVTMLHLINGGYKTEEKSPDLLSVMLSILSIRSSKQSHIQVQECILSILQSLCDSEITLMSSDTGLSVQEQLSNTIPPKDQLLLMYNALIELVGRDRHDLTNEYSLLLLTIRTMLLLTEHDFGFYHLKTVLEEESEPLYRFIKQLSDHFCKDLSEFVSLMSAMVELLRQLTSVDDEISTVIMPRTMCMSIADLALVLKWNKSLPDSDVHPLLSIQDQMNNCTSEEEGYDTLQDSVSLLIQLLNEASNKDDIAAKEQITEPILQAPDTLSNQFAARATFMIADSDDFRLSPSYWFCQPSFEDGDFDSDQLIELDLIDIAEKYRPQLDLKNSIEKAFMPNENFAPKEDTSKTSTSNISRTIGKKRYHPFVNPAKRDYGGSRGRGFGRGGMNNRLNDPFRSRPPNTSRPPSMHVDDFVALEKNQSGSSSNSNSNNSGQQSSKRITKYKGMASGSNSQKGMARDNIRANRNWAFDHHQLAPSSRNRFFIDSPYPSRRDNNRGNNLPGRGDNRNPSNIRGSRMNPKSLGPSPRTFSRPNYDARQLMPKSRDGYSGGWPKGRTSASNAPHWGDSRRFGTNNGRLRREGTARHGRNPPR